MTDNIVTFPGSSERERVVRSRKPVKADVRGPNMQRLVFRSSHLIVESDEADLVRDVGFAVDRAQTKLKAIRRRLYALRPMQDSRIRFQKPPGTIERVLSSYRGRPLHTRAA